MGKPLGRDGLTDWSRKIIEGPGGMNDFERYELVVWHTSERVAAADWTIRCLANPECVGSQEVLDGIIARRAEPATEPKS